MPKIVQINTENGKYKLDQHKVKDFISYLFSDSNLDLERLIKVFDTSEIKTRYISAPIEWYDKTHNFRDRNHFHHEAILNICTQVTQKLIDEMNCYSEDIDHIIFVNSTGISTPTIDSYIINKFEFKNNIKRTPIWGLGCAGGVAGLNKAFEYTMAFPEHNCLFIAAELCSLTFQKDDISKSNIIAASLFSDGAAALFIAGDKSKYYEMNGPEFKDSLSTFYYDSSDVMGWEIVDNGFKVIFSRDIPTIIKSHLRVSVDNILSRNDLNVNDIEYFVTHPGGIKVLIAIAEALEIDICKLNISKNILCNKGNMSSVSVLFVLAEFIRNKLFSNNKFGLMSSLGPGFCSELTLFRT